MNFSYCQFTDLEIKSGLTQKRRLGGFLNKLIYSYTKRDNQLQYVFCSDDYLLQINQKYLNHDTYTDIITFDLSEGSNDTIVSEIYISIDRVKENAKEHTISYLQELLRVIIHGALHMSGFQDKSKKEMEQMHMLEDEWMIKYDLLSSN